MKKKNLIILLLIPFLISLLSIVTINATFDAFNSDITSIEWSYDDVEAFKLESRQKLYAYGTTTSDNPLAPGNNLVWSVENKDKNILNPIAEIEYSEGDYYLVGKAEGEVIVTCSNEKGNIFRKMTVVIYDKGAIILQPEISGSQNNIDSNIYYGEYDLDVKTGAKTNAKFSYKLTTYPSDLKSTLEIKDISSNISVAMNNDLVDIEILNTLEDATFTVRSTTYDNINPVTINFKIVDEGINVYTYQQLLACTNKSINGEIVVLRKSFESLSFYNSTTNNNTELFGTYQNSKFNFKNEIYKFETTYNTEFIKQWNNFALGNKKYSTVNKDINVGLRVQKDFYGNGYTINLHNLTYPSTLLPQIKDGKTYYVPTLGIEDIFRGPLPFYTLGDPNNLPLVSALGQDNIGLYIDGDNITINDINVRNCDIGSSISFLEYTGTVVEINGDNNVIKNSRLSNGRNVLRSFSSYDLLVDNSLLSNSMNFLITTGSNEYVKINESKAHEFINSNDSTLTMNVKNYLDSNYENRGNDTLNDYLNGKYTDTVKMGNSLDRIQNALSYSEKELVYKGNMVINDTYFYNSGLAAIALETLFNGPFLYNATPTRITDLFSTAGQMTESVLVPFAATNVSGVSYPVNVSIKGNTRFYDYKIASDIDLSGLIDENISTIIKDLAQSMGGIDLPEINVDFIFPLKTMLVKEAKKDNCITTNDNKEYMNIPIAYYGGGVNLSTVTVENAELNDVLKEIPIDFKNEYLGYNSSTGQLNAYMGTMLKSVTVVTGFEPFKFVCVNNSDYLFGENPNVSDLITNAKGE